MNIAPRIKLTIVKSIHTLIWAFFAAIIIYVLLGGITGYLSIYSWLAVIAVVMEGVILIICKGQCPLTKMARRYSDSTEENFDIYLPAWLAKYNKHIFTTLFCLGLALMFLRYFHII